MLPVRSFRLLFALLLLPFCAIAQNIARPKLVVGIVVDQMRYDYLWRYYNQYGTGGFRELLANGRLFSDAHFGYFPTYTGPGHACIYTGTTPATNGIVGNNWFDARADSSVYVTDDGREHGIGMGKGGAMSPRNLLAPTLTDELKMTTQGRSKVIALALKDRGAILPGGHRANAAYWYDGATGHWATSSYYMAQLPAWVQAFNAQEKAVAYQKQTWARLLPAANYTASSADSVAWEGSLWPGIPPTLPVDLSKYPKKDLELLRTTPFGNTLTTDFALAALENEKLGQGTETDFLCISYSSTDYVGHRFGPESVEVEDTYLRLDADIARLLADLKKRFGSNVVVFLTADHGANWAPGHLTTEDMPGGVVEEKGVVALADSLLGRQPGQPSHIRAALNQQLYLAKPEEAGLLLAHRALFARFGIKEVVAGAELPALAANPLLLPYARGHYALRSGHVYFLFNPGYTEGGYAKGTTHGQPYAYDTHVPLLFYGMGISQGEDTTRADICDIAPTLANLLRISAPGAGEGRVLPLK